jgi:hypothetical protein
MNHSQQTSANSEGLSPLLVAQLRETAQKLTEQASCAEFRNDLFILSATMLHYAVENDAQDLRRQAAAITNIFALINIFEPLIEHLSRKEASGKH